MARREFSSFQRGGMVVLCVPGNDGCPVRSGLSCCLRSLLRQPELVAEAEEITSTLLVVENDQHLADEIAPRCGRHADIDKLSA